MADTSLETRRIAALETEISALKAALARLQTSADAENARHAMELRAAVEAEAARHRKAFRLAEQRLRLLLDSAVDYAIATIDADQRVAFWNAGAERIFGWQEKEVIGTSFERLFTAEDQAAGVPASVVTGTLAEGRTRNDRWHQRADGSRFWASGWAMAIREPADLAAPPTALLLILRDRTAERQFEDALRESEEKLRHTVELNPQIPFTADADGRIVDFSSRWAALTGQVRAETLGHGWAQALLPTDAPRILAAWQLSLATGTPCDVEGRLRTKEGRVLWFRTRIYPRRDAAGTVVAWHGTLEDIHNRKMAEERLRALVELGDRLRDLRDPHEITLAAAGLIGRTLDVTRAGFAIMESAEVARVRCDWTDGSVRSVAGPWNLSRFWDDTELPLGPLQVTAVSDVLLDPRTRTFPATYAAIEVRAYIWAPILIDGQVAAFLFVHSATPRSWSDEEVSFARGVAERAWSAIDRVVAEERQMLMTRELNHRVKNTLSVVQGLALQTARGSPDLAAFGPAFQARLFALARAHDLLMRRKWTGTSLQEVIVTTLASGNGIGLDLEGCAKGALLPPHQSLSLAMALHELETNAVKHGALSVPDGSVHITCRNEPGDGAHLVDWEERGGPTVTGPPARRGFGLRLLERGIMVQAGLTTTLDFRATGLHCTLRLPYAASS